MNFLETLRGLPLQRQLVLLGAVIGVSVAMMFMVRGAMNEPMVLLYSGLDPQHAGDIISELDQSKIDYEIDLQSIFVPRSDRDRIRFNLAQKGLPKQAVKGYELLDDVNGFSVTSEMYNASYWRAKEGELTRTILAISGVDAARVHIGASLRSGFSRSKAAQTASVTLTTTRDLSTSQAEAIQYMVALAVSGLNPKDVVVIDPQYGILAGPNVDKTARPLVAAADQASALEAKILRLLEARLGPGNAQVSVSLDVRRERELISQIEFDPGSQVVRQRTTNDVSEQSAGSGGAVTVASNLPQGGEGAGGTQSTAKNSSESIAYELNEVRTEIERLPGEVTRMSIAVLVNELALGIDPADVAAAEALVAEFETLIASGAGLNVDRGDAITVETMPFSLPVEGEMTPAPSMMERLLEQHMWSAIQALLLGLVTLALGMGVIRPILKPKLGGSSAEVGAGATFGEGSGDETAPADAFDFLKDYAREREEETAALLQEWLNDDRGLAVNE
jgi:flagellar M-ring protein FliF